MTKKTPFFLQLKAITIVLLALVLISAFPVAAEKPHHTKAQATSTIIKVQDGDTIKLTNGTVVRFLWLDTPETHHPEQPVKYFGVKASAFNMQLVGGKNQVRVRWNTAYDHQQREVINS